MAAFELVDPKLPHQLKLLWNGSDGVRATCNCSKWSMVFRSEVHGELNRVKAAYQDHLPK